jgi:hypothetical protein
LTLYVGNERVAQDRSFAVRTIATNANKLGIFPAKQNDPVPP